VPSLTFWSMEEPCEVSFAFPFMGKGWKVACEERKEVWHH
jgi:hypothetical protein